MTKTEKRHFKVQAKTNPKNKNMVLLFDLIDNQSQYDEKQIKDRISDAQFLKHFAVNKSRLNDFILKTLRSYYSGSNTRISLLNQLVEIEILFNKKLYIDCKKRIEKAQNIAKDHGANWLLLKLNDWEEKLLKEDSEFLQNSLKDLSTLHTKNEGILQSLVDSNSVKYHYFDLLLHSRNSVTHIEQYKLGQIQSALIKVTSSELDYESFIDYLNLEALYNYYINRHEASLKKYIEVVQFIEEIPDGIKDFNRTYFTALNNVLITQSLCKKYTEANTTLEVIHSKFGQSKAFEQDLFAITSCYELSIYSETGNVKAAERIIANLECNLNTFEVTDTNKYLFYFNCAKIKIFNSDFDAAQNCIENILNDYPKKQKQSLDNLFYYSNILNLLILAENNELEKLGNEIPKAKRRLLQIGPLTDIDISTINLLEGMTLASPEKHRELFVRTDREIDHILQLPNKTNFSHFFDISSWIKSKLEPTDFLQIVKAKYNVNGSY